MKVEFKDAKTVPIAQMAIGQIGVVTDPDACDCNGHLVICTDRCTLDVSADILDAWENDSKIKVRLLPKGTPITIYAE